MAEHTPTPQQIADAIEIPSMCEPISDVQGGMWFGRNHNLADATFVDYGACRAFAVAVRAFPHLVKHNDALVKALEKISRECDGAPAFNSVWAASVQAIVREALRAASPLEGS